MNMGKKKGKVYKGIVLTIAFCLMFGFASFAAAEQQFYPGFIDKEGELGTDGKSWRIGFINTIVFEGISNTSETLLRAVDATSDRVILLPDESGTLATTASIGTSMALSNATMLIGNIGGLAIEATMTGDVTVTNALVATVGKIENKDVDFATVTDGFLQIATDAGGGSWDAVSHTLTGDVTGTMANTGAVATTIPSGTINRARLLMNVLTVNIAAGTVFTDVTVETGSILLGWYISNAGAINGITLMNTVEWGDPTARVSINGTGDATQQTSFVLIFSRP